MRYVVGTLGVLLAALAAVSGHAAEPRDAAHASPPRLFLGGAAAANARCAATGKRTMAGYRVTRARLAEGPVFSMVGTGGPALGRGETKGPAASVGRERDGPEEHAYPKQRDGVEVVDAVAADVLLRNVRRAATRVEPDGMPSAGAARGTVPEPGDWAVVLVGLLGVGAIARRRMSS